MKGGSNNKKQRWATILIGLIVLAIAIALVAIIINDVVPLLIKVMQNTGDESATVQYVQEYGIRGVPIIAALQVLQIITAFLPAPPIQMLAGLVYGIWWGSLICLVGALIGNTIVFLMVRHGSRILKQYFPRAEKEPKNRFLSLDQINRMKHPEWIVITLYLVPGMPNGLVPYVFARTEMKLANYLLYVTIGSIPSILMSAGFGTAISAGHTDLIVILGIIMVIIFILAIVFKNQIMSRIEAISE